MRLVLILAFILGMSNQAHADDIFTLYGNGADITFTLPESPTISSLLNYNAGFELDNVSITAGGTTAIGSLRFLNGPTQGGGVDIYEGKILEASTRGYQLFTGSYSEPTFILGTFVVNQELGGVKYNPNRISITPASSVTPEPSGIILLGTGLLGLVGMTRKRVRAHD